MAGRRAEESDWERRLVDVHDAAERVVAAQTRDRDLVENFAQDTVARVVEVSPRLADEALVPYAMVTARNLFLSAMRDERRRREGAHRIVERTEQARPEEHLLEQERHGALYEALERLGDDERRTVLAHEVAETDTRRLAGGHGTSPGAVAVRLAGIRAKLRVEYLLSFSNVELPTDRCRSLLVALSAGDRRRQGALRTGDHLLHCRPAPA